MSSRDPWEGQRAFQPEQQRTGLFRGPNLPFTLTIIGALGVLVAFVFLAEPFASDTVASGTTAPTTLAPSSSDAGTDTTTAGSESTDASGDTTATTASETTGATEPTIPADLAPLQGIALQTVASGIPFPVYATSLPGDPRVFVVERQGRIVIVDGDGTVRSEPFLDLLDRVGSGGIENGLLGMAFHPDYASNGRFFVYYTDSELDSRVSEFSSSGLAANTASPSSEQILFEVGQDGIRHRAGMMEFGPDGYLWIAMGDGGLGDDSAQNLQMMQGNIHRIDVDSGSPYAIPPTNPFADGAQGRPEIWSYGLRNPWRFSIDFPTRTIYIGDVGQATWEEINVASIDTPGLDFGWPNFEGTQCYQPSDGCGMTGWEEPVIQYDHGAGCSVTGGYVYRGTQIPELYGHYFYADWCNGMVRSFEFVDGQATDERDWTSDLEGAGQVASFGIDGNGELLIVNSNGTVSRIVPVR
jgi:glucose/arabinose dehydrogenase